MQTTTLQQIREKNNAIVPDSYYEWGNEPVGFVNTGLYVDDVWRNTGIVKKDEALRAGLKFHCPYN